MSGIKIRGGKLVLKAGKLVLPNPSLSPRLVLTPTAIAAAIPTSVPLGTVLADGVVENGTGNGVLTLTLPAALAGLVDDSGIDASVSGAFTNVADDDYTILWSYDEDGVITTGSFGITVLPPMVAVPTSITSSAGSTIIVADNVQAGQILTSLGLSPPGSGTWTITGGTYQARGGLSAASGASSNLTLDDVTGLTAGGSGTIQVSAAGSGWSLNRTFTVNVVAASSAGTIAQVTLLNNKPSTASLGWARFGLAIDPNLLTVGTKAQARVAPGGADVDTQMFWTNDWDQDQSKRKVVLDVKSAATIAGGGKLDLEIYAKTGSQSLSSFNPWTWISGHANDFTAEITNRTGYAGTAGSRNGVAYTSNARPDLTFSLKAAIATTSRRFIIDDTARFVRIMVNQKLAVEEHLVCRFHLDFHLDTDGATVQAIEFTTVLAQPWHVDNPFGIVQTKEEYTYNVAVKYGSTVLDSRAPLTALASRTKQTTNVGHASHCAWASLNAPSTGIEDSQYAKKHWINISGSHPMPSVVTQYSVSTRQMFARNGFSAPLNWLGTYTFEQDVFEPLGRQLNVPSLQSTGPYNTRGIQPNTACISAVMQTAAAQRRDRLSSQAGLHAFIQTWDHRTDRWGIIPAPFDQPVTGSTTYPDLGTPIRAYRAGGGTLPYSDGIGWIGGTGVFSNFNVSHGGGWSEWFCFSEGEYYMMDGVLGILDMCMRYLSEGLHRPGLMYAFSDPRPALVGMPTGQQWGPQMALMLTPRALAWGLGNLRAAWCQTAKSDPHYQYIRNLVENTDRWMSASLDYFDGAAAPHRDKGGFYVESGFAPPWQINWQAMNLFTFDRAVDWLPTNSRGLTGAREAGIIAGRIVVDLVRNRVGVANSYTYFWGTDDSAATLTGISERSFHAIGGAVTISSNRVNSTPNRPADVTLMNGDVVVFSEGVGGGNAADSPVPTGINYGQKCYAINVVGNTYQIALTPGGAVHPLDIATAVISIEYQDGNDTVWGSMPGSDDVYAQQAFCAWEICVAADHPDIEPSDIAKGRTWIAPWYSRSPKKYAPWDLRYDIGYGS